jgi:hypothetical protein
MANERKYIDFLFHDVATGEDFLVELVMDGSKLEDLLTQAQEIADENFANAEFQEVVSEEDAEMMGIDTY